MAEPSVLTVTMNPTVDVGMTVEYLVPDHKLRATGLRRDPGGGGVNVSRVLRRLDVASRAWITAGGPTGEELAGLVEAERVPTVVHPIPGTTREAIGIRDDKRDEHYRIVLPGPRIDDAQPMVGEVIDLARAADIVVLSGSLPPGVPADTYASICAALADTTTTVVDSSGDVLAAVVAGHADVVKPSRRELASLVDWTPADHDEIVLAARRVLERGEVRALVVSLGADGAVLVEGGREVTWYEAPEVEVESTVGSGDSMVAGIVAGLARGASLVDAVAVGVAAGTAAVVTPGTELCRAEDVASLRPQVIVR